MNNPFITNLVGYTAALAGTFLMLPQLIKSIKTKKTADLSITGIILYIVNCCLWTTYGFLLFAIPMVIANAIGIIIGIAQLVLKLKYR